MEIINLTKHRSSFNKCQSIKSKVLHLKGKQLFQKQGAHVLTPAGWSKTILEFPFATRSPYGKEGVCSTNPNVLANQWWIAVFGWVLEALKREVLAKGAV